MTSSDVLPGLFISSYQSNHTEALFVPTYDDFSRIKYINYGSGMHRVTSL